MPSQSGNKAVPGTSSWVGTHSDCCYHQSAFKSQINWLMSNFWGPVLHFVGLLQIRLQREDLAWWLVLIKASSNKEKLLVVACGWVTLGHPNSAFPPLWWYSLPSPRLPFGCWPVDRSVSVWGWRCVTGMRSSLKHFSLTRLHGSALACVLSQTLCFGCYSIKALLAAFALLCCRKPRAVNFMLTKTARHTTAVGLMQLRHATNGRFPFCIVLLCCAHVHPRCWCMWNQRDLSFFSRQIIRPWVGPNL